MEDNSSGNENTAIGYLALQSVNSGSNNTGIGQKAGDNITTGSSNIIIGSGIDAPSATASTQLNIGNWIIGKDNGKVIGYGKGSNALHHRHVTLSGQVDAVDNVWTTVAYLNHTHSGHVHLLVYDGERGAASGAMHTAYGLTHYSIIGTTALLGLSGLEFRYNNSGYVLQIRVNSNDGANKEVNWTWTGMCANTPYVTS